MTDDLTPQGAAAVRLAATVVQLRAERDRARGIAVALEQRLARIEALPAEFDSEVDWSSGRWDYGDNAAWESAARQLRAALEADQ